MSSTYEKVIDEKNQEIEKINIDLNKLSIELQDNKILIDRLKENEIEYVKKIEELKKTGLDQSSYLNEGGLRKTPDDSSSYNLIELTISENSDNDERATKEHQYISPTFSVVHQTSFSIANDQYEDLKMHIDSLTAELNQKDILISKLSRERETLMSQLRQSDEFFIDARLSKEKYLDLKHGMLLSCLNVYGHFY